MKIVDMTLRVVSRHSEKRNVSRVAETENGMWFTIFKLIVQDRI